MKEHSTKQENFVLGLLTFVFICVIIIVIAVSVRYSGILNLKNDASDTTGNPSGGSETTTDRAGTTASSDPEGTASQSSTKYLPATLPDLSTQSSSTTKKPEQTTESSTQSSTQDVVSIIKPSDITDDKMTELIEVKYLTKRPRSRPGTLLRGVNDIVVHYVANPNTSALNNWKYFETQTITYVSAHFIIDMDGSIIQCLPLNEVAYAVGTTEGNNTSISIECCHPDKTGKFTDATYESLVKLVSWLCNEYGLSEKNVKRHYDYWGKACPLYFVNHAGEWDQFKEDLLIQ